MLSFYPEKNEYLQKDASSFQQAASHLIETLEEEKCLILNDIPALYQTLVKQFAFISLCFQYDIPVINIFTDDYKKEYNEAYAMALSHCEPIREVLPFPLWENEIASISMNIRIYSSSSQKPSTIHTLLLCNNNEQISCFLRKEICSISPYIQIDAIVHNIEDLYSLLCSPDSNPFDLVISTLPLSGDFPFIRIRTIITAGDKSRIAQYIKKNLS